MGAFIRRHATILLFVIVIVGLSGAFVRTGRLIRENHELAIQTQELTVQLEATVKQRRIEICAAETETRRAVRALLLSVSDYVGPVRQAAFERRIHDALDANPDDCPNP
jgi:hypothetical protein